MEVSATAKSASNLVSAKRRKQDNNDHHHRLDEFRVVTSSVTATPPPPSDVILTSHNLNSSLLSADDQLLCPAPTRTMEERCRSDRDDDASGSCCSSNGSCERTEFPDLEDGIGVVEAETSTCSGFSRRESGREKEQQPPMDPQPEFSSTSPDSATSAPPPRRRKRNSPPISTADGTRRKQIKISNIEIDDFFAQAEESYRNQVMKKYNFDFFNERPMKGRYEWVRIDP